MGTVAPRALPLALLLTHCAREEYRNADLQLDIDAPLPAVADRVRICSEGVRSRTMGAGGERYALPGLPMDQPAEVVVDVLAEIDDAGQDDTGGDALISVARTVRVTLGASEPYLHTTLETFATTDEEIETCEACLEPCRTSTAAPTEEDSWLLTVRFEP